MAESGRNIFGNDFVKDEETGKNIFADDPSSIPKMGFFEGIGDFFTGKSKMTPEIEGMKEVLLSPELKGFGWDTGKTAFGLLASDDKESARKILTNHFRDKVGFSEDAKGNMIVSLESGDYTLNTPGMSQQDFGKLILDFSAFKKAGQAKTLASAMGRSAAAETGLETIEHGAAGDIGELFSKQTAKDVGLSAGFGLAGRGLEDVTGFVSRALRGGGVSNDLVEAGRQIDVPIKTTDVFPPKTWAGRFASSTAEKIPIVGTGPVRVAQQETREKAVDAFTEKFDDFSYKNMVESLKTQRDRVKRAAGNVLNTTGAKLDNFGEIPSPSTTSAISASTTALQKPGVLQPGGAMADVEKLVETMAEAPQTFSMMKENRTAFREIVNSMDSTARSQLGSNQKRLLAQVEEGMTADMTEFASQNLTAQELRKWKKANTVYAEHAEAMKKSKLKTMLDKGDMTPEVIDQMLFSKNPSEVTKLYSSLTQAGRKNAKAAIINKVLTNLDKRVGGITPNSFSTEMKKLNIPAKTFFKGSDGAELDGLLKVLNATRKAQDASTLLQTGQQVVGAGMLGVGAIAPLKTITAGLGAGGIARLYESEAVRDILLQAASVPAGSTQFEKIMRKFMETAMPIIQSEKTTPGSQGDGQSDTGRILREYASPERLGAAIVQ